MAIKAPFNSFEEFKEQVLEDKVAYLDRQYEDYTVEDFKSGAIMRDLQGVNSDRAVVNDLIRAIPIAFEKGRRDSYSRFWSNIAGDLNKRDTETLIRVMDDLRSEYNYFPGGMEIYLTFALKNDVAWQHYKIFEDSSCISKTSLLYALSSIQKIDDKFLPLMNEVFGEEFTKVYMENKETIDRSPRKWNFEKLIDDTSFRQRNFFDAYTNELKHLTASFGEASDDYECISNALEKDGFREAAEELMDAMLAHKNKYATSGENYNSNDFIRENFPELVKKVEKAISLELDQEKIEAISDICFRQEKIARQIRESGVCDDVDQKIVNRMIEALPDNVEQVSKAVKVFNDMNVSPENLIQMIKCGVEEWMYPVIGRALDDGLISKERLGSKVQLFDAAKAWSISLNIPRKEATAVGKMSLQARMVAGAIYDKISERKNVLKRGEISDIFWKEMKKAQDMGWKKAIIHYCADNARTCGQFLSVYHPEYSEDTRKMLATSVHLKDLYNIDMDRLILNADLWQQYFGIDKLEMFKSADAEDEYGGYGKKLRHKLIKRLAVFDKLFPDERFRLKYLNTIAELDAYSPHRRDEEDAVMWFPHYLSDEKMASFAKFLEKNLYYKDQQGDEILRPLEQMAGIAQIWSVLSEKEEALSYEELLGLSYAKDSIKYIQSSFNQWKNSSIYLKADGNEQSQGKKVLVKEAFKLSDDLNLYQKKLLSGLKPQSQEDIDQLLVLPREEGIERLIQNRQLSSRNIVDLIVGGDSQINDYEREKIATTIDKDTLGDFDPEGYKKIVDKLFYGTNIRKYYADISTTENDNISPEAKRAQQYYLAGREKVIPAAIKCLQCFGEDYQYYFDKIKEYDTSGCLNLLEATNWLPNNLKKEDRKSFMAFIDKHLLYNDGNETVAIRPFDQLKKIGEIWHELTSAQREFNYEKLLGLCYTHKTVKEIERTFKGWKNEIIRVRPADAQTNIENSRHQRISRARRIEEVFAIPDNLRLYQKVLFSLVRPKSQEEIDEIQSYRRKDGMIKIVELLREGNHNNAYNSHAKRSLVDLKIGNNAQINDYEREQIAGMNVDAISSFNSELYIEIVDKIMGLLSKDPEARELFRKYYADMGAEDVNVDNSKIIDIRKHYQESRVWIAQSAVRCMICYGRDYPRFFNSVAWYNASIRKAIVQKKPGVSENDIINVHDALYWFPENLSKKNRQSFKEFIDQNLFYTDENGIMRHRNLSEIGSIGKGWDYLSDEERKKSYDQILSILEARKYKDCKYLAFGAEAKIQRVSEHDYKGYERIYEQGLQVPELIDSSKRFYLEREEDGKVVVELVGRFLPRDDPRVGFFGQYTDCCQHFWGAGKACAVSSVRDPYSQLFVVEKSNGTIVAGSWVWESKIKKDGQYYKALCFDNIEASGGYKKDARITKVYKMILPYLASLNYAKITVGMGFQDGLVDEFPNTELIPMNRNYSGYSDAGKTQKLLLANSKATPVEYNEGDIYITGALEADIEGMKRVSKRCFPTGDQELQLPREDPQGFVLRDKGTIVGYVVYSEKERSIYDMAVLPEYRSSKLKMPDGKVKKIEYKGGPRSSSLMLLEAMAKKIKAIGGKEKWTAELRDITSFKYMKFMAAKGLVDMDVGDVDHTMSDGTKVIKVKFSVNDQPQKQRDDAREKPDNTSPRQVYSINER